MVSALPQPGQAVRLPPWGCGITLIAIFNCGSFTRCQATVALVSLFDGSNLSFCQRVTDTKESFRLLHHAVRSRCFDRSEMDVLRVCEFFFFVVQFVKMGRNVFTVMHLQWKAYRLCYIALYRITLHTVTCLLYCVTRKTFLIWLYYLHAL